MPPLDEGLEKRIADLFKAAAAFNDVITQNQRNSASPLPDGFKRVAVPGNEGVVQIIATPASVDRMAMMALAGLGRQIAMLVDFCRSSGTDEKTIITMLQDFTIVSSECFGNLRAAGAEIARQGRLQQPGGMFS